MDYLQNTPNRYIEELTAQIDVYTKKFLEKNKIPFTNIEETQKLLREKGYRLIDEQEGDFMSDRKHTLLLVKIIDQTSYTIKAPKLGTEEG